MEYWITGVMGFQHHPILQYRKTERKEHMKDIITTSAQETYQFGQRLGKLLDVGDLVAFSGDLGAGKTCCIQGIAK